ncbi:Mitochondrial 2-oxoglutarate/malate carrier protein [Thelohanellus kitauei]|uniref:Mitochondrial 2-oxoglutarate/malate carrier protein n=1 Tax=Thelohanellus kitauei TaxID=669202 RepID=A0A0C2NFP1_THEKT|nr:Mitochondrial 2-oxoglutarate/malate carrier protein [Thelohanellus kitauei]
MTQTTKDFSKSALFTLSAASGMIATSIVQPIDLVKTRMQLSGMLGSTKEHKTFIHAFRNIQKTEGFFGLYKGLSAALFRQLTYTGTRLGFYSSFEETYKKRYKSNMPTGIRILSACMAGGFGALAGTPAEVALIRMTADGRLKPEERRNYRNVVHALYSIVKNEGVVSLWTGVGPTVTRAVVLNAVQLASYSEIKQFLIRKEFLSDGLFCHFTASFISGFFCAVATTPIDTIKTRIQNSKGEFTGILDVVSQTVKKEGLGSLMKGFTPLYLRIGPHTILTFIVFEQLKKALS